MSGKQYPLTMVPRYTTYAGANSFRTLPMDVSPFETAIVSVWVGVAIGSGPTVTMLFEESTDQEAWVACTGGGSFSPVASTETQKTVTLSRRFFRMLVTLSGTNVAVTAYAIGYLVARVH